MTARVNVDMISLLDVHELVKGVSLY